MAPSRLAAINPKRKNFCFVCGEANREGLRLVFRYHPKTRSAECTVRLKARFQGATGYAHGGMIATLLDEAMAKVNGLGGIRAVTLRMTVSYHNLVPIGKPLQLVGWRTRKRGRKIYLHSQLRDENDQLLAEARGLFLAVGEIIS